MTWVRAIGSAPMTAASWVLGVRPAALLRAGLGTAAFFAGAAFFTLAAFFADAAAFFANDFFAADVPLTPAATVSSLPAAYFAAVSLAAGVLPAVVLPAAVLRGGNFEAR